MAHLFGKLEADVHLNASAEKFHEMFSSNPHHIANVTPGKIKAVTKHQGRLGEVGSVLVWNYVLDGKTCVAKTLIEATDPAKNSITWKITEGDVLEHLKSFKATMQAIPKEKGSVVHWTIEYEKLQGQSPDPYSLMQLASEVSRDIDSHLTQGQDDHEEQLLGKVEVDVRIDASADKFHELFTSKPHHIPNISPANIQRAVADANWGKLDSLITWHYVHEGKNCVAKEKIHAVDASKNLITFRVVEGDILNDFKRMDITLQATPKDKGSLVHVTMEYEKLKGHIPDPHTLTKFVTDVVRDVGSHLAL